MMKLLVVDDHPLFREGLGMLLASLAPDATIESVESCEQAVSYLNQHANTTLIFLDRNMPGHTGTSSLNYIRSHFEHIPVVVLSSDDSADIIQESIEAGAMGFVPKSSTSDKLMQALSIVLQGGIYLPESALRSSNTQSHHDANSVALEELNLSPRQTEIFFCLLQGKSNKVIARELDVSEQTVKVHVSGVLRALNATSRTQALYIAASLGLTNASKVVRA